MCTIVLHYITKPDRRSSRLSVGDEGTYRNRRPECNGSGTCGGAGTCVPGTAIPTDDSNPCTIFPKSASPGLAAVGVSALTMRATELSVGPDGRDRMPLQLPLQSGYTYAIDLSAEELASGAVALELDTPAVLQRGAVQDPEVPTPLPATLHRDGRMEVEAVEVGMQRFA